MIKKFIILLIVTFLSVNLAESQIIPNLGGQKTGTSSLEFLKIGHGARAIGMGEAFVAVSDDISSLYWNPAGLVSFKENGLTFSHSEWFVDTRLEFVGAVYHFGGANALGVSLTALNTEDMKVTTEVQPFGTGEYAKYSDIAIGLSYARQMTKQFSFGATVKYVEETLGPLKMRTVLGDLATFYRTGLGTTRFAVEIVNFGGQVSPSGTVVTSSGNSVSDFQSFPPPTLFKIGFAMEPVMNKMHRLTTSVQLNSPSDNAENVGIGAEYAFKEMFFIRGGYKFNVDAENFSAGAGIKVPISFAKLDLDYAISNYRALGLAHRISINLLFPGKNL
jgi:hypothetical protein